MVDDSSATHLAAQLRHLARGLRPGDRLPSTRALVAERGVSPVTVARAVARLVADGTVVTHAGRGTFVAARPAGRPADTAWQTVALGEARVDADDVRRLLTVPDPDTLILSSGYLAEELQPIAALSAAARRALRRGTSWGRVPPAGLPELRAALAAGLGPDAGVEAGDVLVTPGGQAGLSAALRGLAPSGAAVLVEVPTYSGALAAVRAAGLRPVPVPTDADGLLPDLLADAFHRTGSRVLYAQPTYANPTGAVLSGDRRTTVLDIVREAGAFVIEDDWARALGIDRPPPSPLVGDDPDGHVVHLMSLTKPAAPSLRVGALVARGQAAARLAAIRMVEDFFVARPMQEIAVELLGTPAWQRHLTTLRGALRARRDALTDALAGQLPELVPHRTPGGGLHLWCPLPAGVDDRALAARASRADVLVQAGSPYYVTEPPAPHLRISFCAASPAGLREGVRRLAAVI